MQRDHFHILVVEDDKSYRHVVTQSLVNAGYKVTPTSDFSAALKVVDSKEPIDLLLTDIGLPAGTPHGFSIARVAQSRRPGLAVLYMTDGEDATQFVQFTPGELVLLKPLAAPDLIAAVEAALAAGANAVRTNGHRVPHPQVSWIKVSNRHDSPLDRRRLGAVADPQLLEDPAQMQLDRDFLQA